MGKKISQYSSILVKDIIFKAEVRVLETFLFIALLFHHYRRYWVLPMFLPLTNMKQGLEWGRQGGQVYNAQLGLDYISDPAWQSVSPHWPALLSSLLLNGSKTVTSIAKGTSSLLTLPFLPVPFPLLPLFPATLVLSASHPFPFPPLSLPFSLHF